MKFSSKPSSETAALIPAYNEEKNIEEVIKKTKQYIENIIVIDDGSTDKTNELAKNLGVLVLTHEKNKGKGEAMKTGINHILSNIPEIKNLVIIDADMQYEPSESTKVLQPLLNNEADFVMGCRNWKQVPFRHKLGNFVWKVFFNILFGTKLKDVSCGIIALTRKSLEEIKNISGGYIIESSILAQCITNRLRISQAPVNVTYKQKSGIVRGIRMVLGIMLFITTKGIKYRLDNKRAINEGD
jgi:glycosyltransferase involved in cell wall biosynthesis